LAVATGPLANEFAGGTVVVVGALGAGDADALAAGDPLADGLAAAPSADWLMSVLCDPETAITAPRVTPNATGMAIGIAIRAARLRPARRRHADRCPVRIKSTSIYAVGLLKDYVIPGRQA
jgi:hypothetical protein